MKFRPKIITKLTNKYYYTKVKTINIFLFERVEKNCSEF